MAGRTRGARGRGAVMTLAHGAAPEPGEAAVASPLPAAVRLCFLAGPMLSMIDSSVVNVAVPSIVGGLHASLGAAAWAVSGYLLGLACGLAATPWLARRYGTLPAYGAALLAFTLASAACALAPGAPAMVPRDRSPAAITVPGLTFPACCCSRRVSAWPPTARARALPWGGCPL